MKKVSINNAGAILGGLTPKTAKKTKPQKCRKKAKPRRKPQVESKNRKQTIRPVEMWVLVLTVLLVGYLITQVTNDEGMSFMTVIMVEMGVIS